MSAPADLAALLVAASALDAASAAMARREAARRGCPLVVELVDRSGVPEEAVARVLEPECGARVPVVDEEVDPEAVREIPHDAAARARALPLAVTDHGGKKVLRVAMADPLDIGAIDALEAASGCVIEPVLALSSEIVRGVERHFRGIVTKLIHRPEPAPAPAPAADHTAPIRTRFGDLRPAARDEHEGTPRPPARVQTTPLHELDREATLDQRLRALLDALYARGVLLPEEYASALRGVLKRDKDEL